MYRRYVAASSYVNGTRTDLTAANARKKTPAAAVRTVNDEALRGRGIRMGSGASRDPARRSAELGQLLVHHRAKRSLPIADDPGGNARREVLERAPGLIERSGFDLPERRDVLVDERLAV